MDWFYGSGAMLSSQPVCVRCISLAPLHPTDYHEIMDFIIHNIPFQLVYIKFPLCARLQNLNFVVEFLSLEKITNTDTPPTKYYMCM